MVSLVAAGTFLALACQAALEIRPVSQALWALACRALRLGSALAPGQVRGRTPESVETPAYQALSLRRR